MSKPKVVYIIGPAYSGSTLLGLVLGKVKGAITLGEVTNIENDYHHAKYCICGSLVSECSFWSPVIKDLNDINSNWQFNGTKYRHIIDQRGGWQKVPIVLGFKPSLVFSKETVREYAAKNTLLFKCVHQRFAPTFMVDLSKLPERLDILLENKEIDIYCIYLKRNLKDVFASTISRPKKTRSKFGFKVLREAIWLNLRTNHEKRIFRKVDKQNKLELNFNEFILDPNREIAKVLNWLEVEDQQDFSSVDTSKQHLFVGNRWLFKLKSPIVGIERGYETKKLNSWQNLLFMVVSKWYGNA